MGDEIPPAAPSDVQAVPEGSGIRVSWDLVLEEDVYRYRVLRREEGQENYTPAGMVYFNQKSLLNSTNLTPGVTYCYVVIARDTDYNDSAYSLEACATAP